MKARTTTRAPRQTRLSHVARLMGSGGPIQLTESMDPRCLSRALLDLRRQRFALLSNEHRCQPCRGGAVVGSLVDLAGSYMKDISGFQRCRRLPLSLEGYRPFQHETVHFSGMSVPALCTA